MTWILFVVFAALGDIPEELIVVHTEFPLITLEECTEKAEELAIESMERVPELTNYKFYHCKRDTI